MAGLTSRERVLAALHHEEPDRVPIVVGASNATGVRMNPYRELKKLIGIEAPDRCIYDWPELGTALLDEAALQRLHSDVRGVLDAHPQTVIERNRQREPHAPFFDAWGIGQVEITPGVWYPGIYPLKDARSIDEIERYSWPDPADSTRIAHVRQQARALAEQNEYAIMATPWLLFPFERALNLQGMESFLVHMAANPEFAQALLEKIAGLCKALMEPFLEELGDHVDMIKMGDDLGSQLGLLISPAMYRRFLKPIHAEYIAFIKERTRAKVFFHTDGDVSSLIDDFVEIGVDILNPIQTSAGRMSDLAALKKRYGKELVFCGAIDTQQVLPHGTPEDVRREVQRVIELLGPGGGYLLAAVHIVGDDVPAQNLLAMVDAAVEFGQYPLRR